MTDTRASRGAERYTFDDFCEGCVTAGWCSGFGGCLAERDARDFLVKQAERVAEVTRLQEENTKIEKSNAILRLAVPLEEDLSNRIDEMLKYLAMEDGFTLAGIARLLNEVQRRMAADWDEIGRERLARNAAEGALRDAQAKIDILTAGDSDNPIRALNTHAQTGTCLEHGSQLSSGKGHAGISPQASGQRDQVAERPAVRTDKLSALRGGDPRRQWQDIASAPKDEKVFFWVVPKTADEVYTDTSGNPIFSTHEPYLLWGKWRNWSALSKAVAWHRGPITPPDLSDPRRQQDEQS